MDVGSTRNKGRPLHSPRCRRATAEETFQSEEDARRCNESLKSDSLRVTYPRNVYMYKNKRQIVNEFFGNNMVLRYSN